MSARNVYKTHTTPMRKSRLPIKTALKIGCSNFKYHPFRLITTIMLSVIAFSLLGIALTVAFLNPAQVFSDAIIRDGMEFTAIYKYEYYEDPNRIDQSLDQFLGEPLTPTREVSMTVEDVEFLKSQVGNSYTLVYSADIFSFQSSIAATLDQMNEAAEQNPDTNFLPHANGYIAMSEEECARLGYTVIGELPKDASEVAINECIYNVFSIAGLIEDEQLFEISSYEDIIGHRISVVHNTSIDAFKTISGVVITSCDRACYHAHNDPEDRISGRDWENYHDKIFVCQDYFDEYTYALSSIPPEKTELTKMINLILESEENDKFYELENKLSGGFYSSYYAASVFKMLALYLSIIFLLFAMLLLSNFIFTSMRRQMKQIGILSALGAGFKDLCKVYGSAILAMCSVIAAITLVIQILGVNWFNAYLRADIHDLLFDLVPFSLPATLLLVLIMAAVAAAGCLIPLIRLQKLEPTTIINKGQIK